MGSGLAAAVVLVATSTTSESGSSLVPSPAGESDSIRPTSTLVDVGDGTPADATAHRTAATTSPAASDAGPAKDRDRASIQLPPFAGNEQPTKSDVLETSSLRQQREASRNASATLSTLPTNRVYHAVSVSEPCVQFSLQSIGDARRRQRMRVSTSGVEVSSAVGSRPDELERGGRCVSALDAACFRSCCTATEKPEAQAVTSQRPRKQTTTRLDTP